jgi:hypothetical protein
MASQPKRAMQKIASAHTPRLDWSTLYQGVASAGAVSQHHTPVARRNQRATT